jgi:hypothetical protein
MARNPRKKALYEVIGKSYSKSRYDKSLEPLRPSDTPDARDEKTKPVAAETPMRWPRKPRVVQYNAGRIEFSMPYQLGIAIVLSLVVLFLISFRVGQFSGSRNAALQPQQPTAEPVIDSTADAAETSPVIVVDNMAGAADVTPADTAGPGNHIVIQAYQVRAHLVPVKEYFDSMGVETEIRLRGGWYYLITKNTYDDPSRPGTDGYRAKERIVELGRGYTAPTGYETFAPNYFSDAYGKKFDD